MRDRLKIVLQSIAGIPVSYCGFAFQKAYSALEPFPKDAINAALPFSLGGIHSSVVLILVALAAMKFGDRRTARIAFPLGIALQACSSVVLAATYYFQLDSAPLLVVAGIGQAAGTVAISALWVRLCAALNPVRATFLNAGAILIAAALVWAIETSSLARLYAISIALPFITGAFYFFAARHDETERANGLEDKPTWALPWKEASFIAACSFAYGVASASIRPADEYWLAAIPALVIMVYILLDTKRFNLSVLIRLTFPLMLAGFLLVAIIPEPFGPLSSILYEIGYDAMAIFLILTVCAASYGSSASPLWLFGILAATQFLSKAFGSFIGGTFLSYGSEGVAMGYQLLQIVSMLLVAISVGIVISKSSLFPTVAETPQTSGNSVRVRINALSVATRLTDRETEILLLIASGKTNAQIANDLFISEGTARAHLHHIYTKLGVHTRKELVALLEKG